MLIQITLLGPLDVFTILSISSSTLPAAALTPHINHTHHSHPYPNTSSSVLENVCVNH